MSRKFVVAWLEKAALWFILAFGAIYTAEGGFSKAAAGAGILAGVRAVYGYLVKSVGETDKPSLG